MNFKKSREEVINDAHAAALRELTNGFGNLKYNAMNNPLSSNIDSLQWTIQSAITAAVKTLVENTYTDQEFEEDLGLRDKK